MININVSNLLKWIIYPLCLFFISVILFIIYFFSSDINPNTRSHNHDKYSIKSKAGIVSGKFIAQDNYLSLITINFKEGQSQVGQSIFRIKNVVDKDWYHEATVSGNQFYYLPKYIFGIPPIAKSKNQTYMFEVKLLDNPHESSSLLLSNKYPILISQYLFPKDVLLNDKALLINFIFKKLSYYIYGDESWKVFIVYSIPLSIYILYISFLFKYIPKELIKKLVSKLALISTPFIFLVFLSMFIDIFIIRKYSESVTMSILFFWFMGTIAYQLESRYSFGVALILITFCPFLLSANMDWVAEKSAVWAYMFLVVGTVHGIIEMKAERSPKLTLFLNFISKIFSFICHIDSFLLARAGEVKQFATFSVRNFAKVITVFIIIITLLFFGFDAYLKYMSYLDRQLKNPGAPQIEPTLVYPGTRVFLYGDRFGDGVSGKYALMKDGVKIHVDYWEDHKIIFTVPLDWKPGPMNLWIEKPVEWNTETVIEKTKPIIIKLLKVTGSFSPDDDLYFEEMKSWKKETLELNGYNVINE